VTIPINAADIGPKFDVLIGTRDGSTLSCAGRPPQRTPASVSQVAYMCSTQVQQGQHEATELQRMTNLITQASQQETDRTFDAWPQVDQGDWSDGMLQRVFSGGQSKPTRYWDGLGVIWPITDYLPQQAVLGNPDQGEAGAIMKLAGSGVTGGLFGPFGGVASRAMAYMQNAAPQHNILWVRSISSDLKIDPIPGSVNGTPSVQGSAQAIDYCLGLGYLWLVTPTAGGVTPVTVGQYSPSGLLTSTTIVNAQTFAGGGSWPGTRAAVGIAGNKPYLAVTWFSTVAPTAGHVFARLYDLSNGLALAPFVDLQLSHIGDQFATPVQMVFQSDNLVIAMVSGQDAALVSFNIPGQAFSTLANFPQINNLFFCSIAGGLFVLATNVVANAGFGDTVNMYLLFGGQLQHIGPVTVQATAQGVSNVISGECEPVAFGPYALFPIYYFPVGGSTTSIAVFAYDVLRGRLFKLQDFGGFDQFLGNSHGRRCAITSPVSRGTALGALVGQWAVDTPVLSASGSAQDVSNARGAMIGVSVGSFSPFLQQGCVITSSLIDYTSSQNKLYRQVVASFTALPNDAAITVRLDAWLDQDPASLAAVPDFTQTLAGNVNVGVKQLKLLVNSIARKLVYRVTTTGPSAANGAVKLISVATQLSTGWNIHYFLDLARSARTNGGNAYAYQEQGLDELQAYNFLRQLWRLKGGECKLTLANGDSYNAILQLVEGASSKPFGASSLGQEPTFQQVCEIRLREDV
jgi:hypothetical protein